MTHKIRTIEGSCPICRDMDEYENSNIKPVLPQLKALRRRRHLEHVLQELERRLCNKQSEDSGTGEIEIDIRKVRNKLKLLGRLAPLERKKLKLMDADFKKTFAGFKAINDVHPVCAACGIHLGEGHIMEEYDVVRMKGRDGTMREYKFCHTCPRVIVEYADWEEKY
jgi:hypothetical protein